LKYNFSIILTTYNSAKFIVDALESVAQQSFTDFELIVTDDCSTDNTVEIVKTYLQNSTSLSNKTKVIEQEVNIGIAKNENSAISIAQGEWIHVLAGDDALMPDALQNVADFIANNLSANFIHGIAEQYSDDFHEHNFDKILYPDFSKHTVVHLNAKMQYKQLLKGNCIVATTTFFKKEALGKVGFFDETIYNLDDWTTFLNITKSGETFYFIPQILAKYRSHQGSVCNSADKAFLNGQHRQNRGVYKQYINPNVGFLTKLKNNLIFYLKEFIFRFFNKKPKFLSKISVFFVKLRKKS
jgi:alpha-1,3-rhamnosyltransferase